MTKQVTLKQHAAHLFFLSITTTYEGYLCYWFITICNCLVQVYFNLAETLPDQEGILRYRIQMLIKDNTLML